MASALSTRLCRRVLTSVVLAAAVCMGALTRGEPPATPGGVAILQDLKSFSQMATVLMIAAHPDDENTNLITYLARGRGYRMGYLSVTRGNGGQNLLGGEFGDELGWIRTQELLAARRLDSGRQFFTRAIDFGYSKSPDETLKIWDREKVLGDVVRVIREFRPDVVVTRFSTQTQAGQHGHHTASAILGVEAFKIAGDPKAYPEQIGGDIQPWQPKRIMLNGGVGGRGGAAGGVSISAGGTDPVLNQTYSAIAGQSRAMHKSQGFGNAGGGGGRGGPGGGNVQESFVLLAGDPAMTDLMDGVDTTWARVGKGGDEIARLTADAIEKFDAAKPEASVPALLQIKKLVAALPHDPIVAERAEKLDRIIANCLGLSVETIVDSAMVTAEQPFALHAHATMRSSMPVVWHDTTFSGQPKHDPFGMALKPGEVATRNDSAALPKGTPPSQPYWLREEADPGIYHVANAAWIGRPDNVPLLPIKHTFELSGQTIVLTDEPVQLEPAASPAQQRRRLEVIAPVSLAFPSEVRLFAPGSAKPVEVEVTAHRANASGSVKVNAPTGWKISPASQDFSLAAVGDHKKFSFTVTPPAIAAGATLSAAATIGGQTYNTGWNELDANVYNHLPKLLMQPVATIRAVALDMKIAGKNIGYLPGAGDSVAECLEQMGYAVTELKTADLTADALKKFDAVVIGVRAHATRNDLTPNSATLKAIFDYAENGGTVVEQYNRPEQGKTMMLAPFPMSLSSLRVTDENAKMTFLVPDSPVLNTPNKITDADFANWVQERNIYLPQIAQDSPFQQILAVSDPNDPVPSTSLLVAKTGKGYFVYTSLVFFRQLPAGNPGAYRLFANLVSLGK